MVESVSNIPVTPERYKEAKKNLKSLELSNQDKIMLLRYKGTGEWYEIAEHSALFYYYKVCDKLASKPNFENDSDSYYYPYEIGRIRTRNPELIISRVKEAKLYKNTVKKNGLIIINLNTKFSQDKIAGFLKTEEERREKNRKIIHVEYSDPTLYRMLCLVTERLHKACNNKMNRVTSQTNGARILTKIDHALFLYMRFCDKKNAPSSEEWDEILGDVQSVIYEINILCGSGIWGHSIASSFGEELIGIRRRIIDGKKCAKGN
ncbi:hypothetical protein IKG28_01550 [Candidatus Saccharibacteria bacterium]|nr:hypothetical protein [Candidatus Saccharibacteria bacterium]